MDNLTPITREEILMNDEPLTPITREEKILAGEDLTPVTRREYFLKKYRHAGGDVMVEGLSVTENGTYTAPEGKAYSPVEVNVPLPENAYLLKTASGSLVSFNDGADLPMPSFICNIDAQQDLHGYDAPWVGGAWKNKLEITNEKDSDTVEGVTWEKIKDSNNNVLGIKIVSGTATSNVYIKLCEFSFKANTSYILNGCPSNGSNQTYRLQITDQSKNDYGDGVTFTPESNVTASIHIRVTSGYAIPSGGLTFYPMIRLATETDPTFAPYSNICPISGHVGVDAWVRGKNHCPVILSDDASVTGYTATVENDGVIIINGTWTGTSNNVIGVNEQVKFNLPAGSYIISGTTVDNYNDYGICLQVYNWNTSQAIGNTSATGYAEFTLETQAEVSVRVFVNNSRALGKTIPLGGIKLYPMIRLATETDSTFEPYNPNSQTIQVSWQTEAGEVFGGYVDLASGELTVTDGYIASYNGETLPSTWISDRDTYAEGTTPTTGAEVVYKLANPQTYQLDGNQIKSLLGNNNAWCDTGDVDIDYFAKEV